MNQRGTFLFKCKIHAPCNIITWRTSTKAAWQCTIVKSEENSRTTALRSRRLLICNEAFSSRKSSNCVKLRKSSDKKLFKEVRSLNFKFELLTQLDLFSISTKENAEKHELNSTYLMKWEPKCNHELLILLEGKSLTENRKFLRRHPLWISSENKRFETLQCCQNNEFLLMEFPSEQPSNLKSLIIVCLSYQICQMPHNKHLWSSLPRQISI